MHTGSFTLEQSGDELEKLACHPASIPVDPDAHVTLSTPVSDTCGGTADPPEYCPSSSIEMHEMSKQE